MTNLVIHSTNSFKKHWFIHDLSSNCIYDSRSYSLNQLFLKHCFLQEWNATIVYCPKTHNSTVTLFCFQSKNRLLSGNIAYLLDSGAGGGRSNKECQKLQPLASVARAPLLRSGEWGFTHSLTGIHPLHLHQSQSSLYAEYASCVGPPKHQGPPCSQRYEYEL